MLPDKMRRTLAVAFVLACSASALAQTDDEKITARELGKEGQAALDKGDAKTAEDRFHRAVQIFDNAKAPVPPTLLLGYARGNRLHATAQPEEIQVSKEGPDSEADEPGKTPAPDDDGKSDGGDKQDIARDTAECSVKEAVRFAFRAGERHFMFLSPHALPCGSAG